MSAPGPVRRAATSRDNWETPWELFNALHREMEFSLDGAATADNAKCERFYTPEMNAFEQEPIGQSIWLNPPYGANGVTGRWVELATAWSKLNRVVLLLPSATDTIWFERLAAAAQEIRLLVPRVQFLGTTSSNPNGSIIAVLGPQQRPCHIWVWRWR